MQENIENLKIESELLQIIGNGTNIDYDDVQNKVFIMLKRKEALSKHEYDIWQGANGRWYTYLPNDACKNGRKQIAKSSREKIEDAIFDFYQEDQENEKKVNEKITFHELYLDWMTNFKSLKVSEGSRDRIASDYNRFYFGSDLIAKKVSNITTLDCDLFIHTVIKSNDLNSKQCYNMMIIIKQVLAFAVRKGIINESPMNQFELAKKVLRKSAQADSKSQVFTPAEQDMIISKAMADFQKKHYLAPLAIALDFQLALRNGELVAIKWLDIEGNYITICRTEIKYNEVMEDGTKKESTVEIKEWPKSDAGYRKLYLTSESREILDLVKKYSIAKGFYNPDGFIFTGDNGRIPTTTTDKYLYRTCLKLRITVRSMHKIRKTVISALIDEGMNLDEVRRIAGHEDIRTLLKSYCFSRQTDDMNESLMEEALCKKHKVKSQKIG